MPELDRYATKKYAGKKADLTKIAADRRWHDQGSSGAHYGFPRRKGLWLLPFEPAFGSDCHPVKLFVLLQLSASGEVETVHTCANQNHPDGAFLEIPTPLFPPDDDRARQEVEAVLSGDASAALVTQQQARVTPVVNVAELQRLIGQALSSAAAGRLIEVFDLHVAPTPLGDGRSATGGSKRLELQTDASDRIRAIFFRPAPEDRWGEDAPAHCARATLRKRLGEPTHSADDQSWDRFDSDEIALHVSYSAGKDPMVLRITLMDPQTAPEVARV